MDDVESVVLMRRRSEYRLRDTTGLTAMAFPAGIDVRAVAATDRTAGARALLDAYHDTIDDEGEDEAQALLAMDFYFSTIEWPHSFVAVWAGGIVGLSFVARVNGLPYIDPVATVAAEKRTGIGRALVLRSLLSLEDTAVGAVITDGNEASAALFGSLGFERHGEWPSVTGG